jgi:hypothetical protein
VFRRILYLVTFCIASLVLLVSTSARASIPQAHQGAKTALSAPSFAAKRIKAKKSQSAECTYRIATATAGMHKGKVALILASCGGTPSVWGWPGQNPIRYRDPTGHWGDGDPRADAFGDRVVAHPEDIPAGVSAFAVGGFVVAGAMTAGPALGLLGLEAEYAGMTALLRSPLGNWAGRFFFGGGAAAAAQGNGGGGGCSARTPEQKSIESLGEGLAPRQA